MKINDSIRIVLFWASLILGLWATIKMILIGWSSLIGLGMTWAITWSVIKALLMIIGGPFIGIMIIAIAADISFKFFTE